MPTPKLILSLDFELHWGMFDHFPLNAAGRQYFDRTRALIPVMLSMFQASGVACTWATVGMLFAKDRRQLLDHAPTHRPAYHRTALNPYALLDAGQVGTDERSDPYHYAPSLIARIADTPGQVLGSHTFSHYYCLEAGQDAIAFRADLQSAQSIAQATTGQPLTAMVFPRHQYPAAYRSVLSDAGFRTVRSNPPAWYWSSVGRLGDPLHHRLVRLTDHYLPIAPRNYSVADEHPHRGAPPGTSASGRVLRSYLPAVGTTPPPSPAHSVPPPSLAHRPGSLVDVPANRFFRPYLPVLDAWGGQYLKLARIQAEMTQAARAGGTYHLWWHPHNMATHPPRNIAALQAILAHYRHLNTTYGMESIAMGSTTIP